MTRDELKEKVARNQYERQFKGLSQDVPDFHDDFTPWEELPAEERDYYLSDACAAIVLVGKECVKVADNWVQNYRLGETKKFCFDRKDMNAVIIGTACGILGDILTLTGEK